MPIFYTFYNFIFFKLVKTFASKFSLKNTNKLDDVVLDNWKHILKYELHLIKGETVKQ